jgi:hypothetical protein
MKHFIVLTCEALARSVSAAEERSPHSLTIRHFRQGLHNTPKTLHDLLQSAIDGIGPEDCDAILLAYGLCGKATHRLQARYTPLVIPRAHDCITLYLGSRQRYLEQFNTYPGTYWYSLDYLERYSGDNTVTLGAASQAALDDAYKEYVEKYGKENADYLMKIMGSWHRHYTRAAYIHMDYNEDDTFEQRAKRDASEHGWDFERLQGDPRLLNQLLQGEWPEKDFLVVPPGHTILQSMDPEVIIQAEKIEDSKSSEQLTSS